MSDILKKIFAGILFVIIVLILGLVSWKLIADIILVSSRANSIFPISPQANNPVGFLDFSNTAPEVDLKDLGEISDYANKILIAKDSSVVKGELGPDDEYLYLQASINNKEPINISGMMLQSLITNKVAIIPEGVETFVLGQVNISKPIYLAPGEAAIVHTGKSPIGYSFKSNMCSGYLNQFKKFNPPLPSTWCPRPKTVIPNTVENVKKYGDTCMEAVASLSPCEYFSSDNEYYKKVSEQCRKVLQEKLTYNACVKEYKDSEKFFYPGALWNVYLDREGRLWKEKYEVIRLLDQESRTVHAISY